MKKISLFLSALAMVAFVSCSECCSEDSETEDTVLVDETSEDGEADDAEAHVCTPECHEEGSSCPHMAASDDAGEAEDAEAEDDHDGHDHGDEEDHDA